MSEGAETLVSDAWVDATLKGDATITGQVPIARIFDHFGKPDAGYPQIVWQMQDTDDVVGIGPQARIMASVVYIVKVIYEGKSFRTPVEVKTLVRRFDDLFEGALVNLADGVVLGSRRDGEYRLVEQHEGGQVRHIGGRYLVHVQSI